MCVCACACVCVYTCKTTTTTTNKQQQRKTKQNRKQQPPPPNVIRFVQKKKKKNQSFLECRTETGRCIPGFVKTHFDEGFILPYKTRCDCVLARKKFPRTAPADCLGPEKGRQRRLPAMFFCFFFHNRDHALSDLDIASARSVCSNALQSYSSHEVACVSFYRHVFGVRLDYP